ncbi:MAG: cobamide remodeling phosphodiesterase CbiR [Promethearchaeota archaeon]
MSAKINANANNTLNFGIILDLQGALELALGKTGKGQGVGLNLNRIDAIEIVRAAVIAHGIKIIELPADANYILKDILANAVDGLRSLRDELDLTYTVHLPFIQMHLCSFNDRIRQASIDTIVETIKICEKIGDINQYVLHVTSELEDQIGSFDIEKNYKSLVWGIFLENGYQSLEEIIAKTDINPKRICIENNEGIPFSETYDILIDDLDLSICLDVGHAILQGEESPLDILRRWGPERVHEIHFHNVHRVKIANRVEIKADHHGLGMGILNIDDFLDYLVDIGYPHPVLLEIMTQKEIAESLALLREKGYL